MAAPSTEDILAKAMPAVVVVETSSARGSAFFDPALTLSRRLRFPPPFSLDYVWNPYLGVGRFRAPPPPPVAGEGIAVRPAPPLPGLVEPRLPLLRSATLPLIPPSP